MATDDHPSRRRILELTGTAGTVTTLAALAGCLSDETSDNGDENGDEKPNEKNGNEDGGKREEDEKDDNDDKDDADDRNPVLFVHGGFGSATQFESQAMRFASNGYPEDHLAVYEYNTGVDFEEIEDRINEELEARIDALRAETGAEQVDVIGHSRGTRVMHNFLASPDRAKLVGNYVNVDGRESAEPPGGVRTLAVWGIGNEEAEFGGAENVSFPQGHVEVATSAETFAAMYEFLTGKPPETTSIVPEPADKVTVSGRTALFPQNEGVEGKLEVYEVEPKTGNRRGKGPIATQKLAGDGSWGPIDVDGSARHEFVVVREGEANQHVYRQPELRSNQFVRLLVSESGGLTDRLIERGPDHATLVISRDKEWWADQDPSDDLLINGLDVITEAIAPLEAGILSPMVFDDGANGETDLSGPVPQFVPIPFLTGVDVHIPAADPPDDTVSVVERPRDGEGLQRKANVPNWSSEAHRISLQFPDHTQTR